MADLVRDSHSVPDVYRVIKALSPLWEIGRNTASFQHTHTLSSCTPGCSPVSYMLTPSSCVQLQDQTHKLAFWHLTLSKRVTLTSVIDCIAAISVYVISKWKQMSNVPFGEKGSFIVSIHCDARRSSGASAAWPGRASWLCKKSCQSSSTYSISLKLLHSCYHNKSPSCPDKS